MVMRHNRKLRVKTPGSVRGSVRSPAFRPQASDADPFRDAKRFRLKAGLRTAALDVKLRAADRRARRVEKTPRSDLNHRAVYNIVLTARQDHCGSERGLT